MNSFFNTFGISPSTAQFSREKPFQFKSNFAENPFRKSSKTAETDKTDVNISALTPQEQQSIRTIIDLQDKLFNLNSSDDVSSFLEFFNKSDLDSKLSIFIDSFILAFSTNLLHTDLYLSLIQQINGKSKVKEALLDNLFSNFTYSSNLNYWYRFYMLRYFYSQSYITKDDILNPIKNNQFQSPKLTLIKVYLFIWFAPEIAADENCSEFKQDVLELMNETNFNHKSTIIEYFKSNKQKYEQCNYQCLLNEYLKDPDDPLLDIIKKDDSRQLIYTMYKSQINPLHIPKGSVFGNPLYSLNYSIAQYSLLFSAENCLLAFSVDDNQIDYIQPALQSHNNKIISLVFRDHCNESAHIKSAIEYHNMSIFFYLFIHNYAQVEPKSYKYHKLLSRCIQFNSLRIFKFILENDPSLDYEFKGEPLLHDTIYYDNYEMFILLCNSKKISFNGVNSNRETALSYALIHEKQKYINKLFNKTKLTERDFEILVKKPENHSLLETVFQNGGSGDQFDPIKSLKSAIRTNDRVVYEFIMSKMPNVASKIDISLLVLAIKCDAFDMFKQLLNLDILTFLPKKAFFFFFFFFFFFILLKVFYLLIFR